MTSARRWGDFAPSLIVLAIAIVYLLWAQIYPRATGTVPSLVAWATIILALIDLAAHTETRLGRSVRRVVGQPRADQAAGEQEQTVGWRTILYANLWPIGYVAAVIVAGFMLTTPLYVLLYMWLHGRKSVLFCAVSGVVTTLLIWLTFEVLFRYPLYQGVLFGGYL
jgi:hypothetical protein